MAKQHVVEKGNEWSALAASSHIRRTKIRDHRNTHSRRDDRGLAGLPRRCDLASEKELRLALVIESLTVAADQVQPRAELARGGQHRIGIELAQPEIQPG